jgi:hypothetical protein
MRMISKAVLFLCLGLVSCVSKVSKIPAPLNRPMPTAKPATEKLEKDIAALEKAVDGAGTRLLRIRLLLNSSETVN